MGINGQDSVDITHVHFIGIGGAGMSGLAHILLDRGKSVTGSDAKDSRVLIGLRTKGATIAIGHAPEHLDLCASPPTCVVRSFAAIPEDNPELVEARRRGIPIIRRSDLLAFIMRDYVQVLIAGTHGKTSTTSLTVVALQHAGWDPSFAIGGQLNKSGTNAHHGSSDIFVAEADESDASLLSYSPSIAVITNVEPDHLDFFHTSEAYYRVFDDFFDRIVPGGCAVVCLEDPRLVECAVRAQARGVTVVGYGRSDFMATAQHEGSATIPAVALIDEWTPTAYRSNARVRLYGVVGDDAPESGAVSLPLSVPIPGVHMALNACAALVAGALATRILDPHRILSASTSSPVHEVPKTLANLVEGIASFTGVRRRFEVKGEIVSGAYKGVRVVDDYAHHPTEVAAVISSAKQQVEASHGHVIVVFQPHLYSRTQQFAVEFGRALSQADDVIVLDIYGAREKPIPGVSGRMIAAEVTAPVQFIDDLTLLPECIRSVAHPGDLILTMGAGNVTVLGSEILHALAE